MDDLTLTKEALKKEKEILEEKEKAFSGLITAQKQKAAEEEKLVVELELTKGQLTEAHKDLETKTNALDAEIKKVKLSDVSKMVSQVNQPSTVKQDERESNSEEKYKAVPCKYFNRTKGCRRGSTCWFYHDENRKAEKKSTNLKQNNTKKFKHEQNVDKESKQDQGANLNQVILELLKLLLRENNI